MTIELGSKKQVIEDAKPGSGWFSVTSSPLIWHRCRDNFAGVFGSDVKCIYISCGGLEAENIAEFFAKTETILELPNLSNFGLTNRKHVIWTEPSWFWRRLNIRRSLFTLLLRTGRVYSPRLGNYEAALYSHKYTRSTKRAIMRFLYGFTEYYPADVDKHRLSSRRGWVATFKHADVSEVRRRLQSPSEKRRLINAGSLWG